MEVTELARGEYAPEGADRITLKKLPNARFGYTAVHKRGNVTAHSTFAYDFEDEDHALHHALQWAENSKIDNLHVERPDA